MRWAIGGSLDKFQNCWFAVHQFGPKENWTVELMRIAVANALWMVVRIFVPKLKPEFRIYWPQDYSDFK